jgi:hypothetical protein
MNPDTKKDHLLTLEPPIRPDPSTVKADILVTTARGGNSAVYRTSKTPELTVDEKEELRLLREGHDWNLKAELALTDSVRKREILGAWSRLITRAKSITDIKNWSRELHITDDDDGVLLDVRFPPISCAPRIDLKVGLFISTKPSSHIPNV